MVIFWITLAVFLLTQGFFLYSLIRFRRRPGVPARHSHGSRRLEIAWTAIPTAIFLGLFFVSDALWFKLRTPPPAGRALDIEIVGEQYDWLIRYPGPDGVLGRADDGLETVTNKIGLDPSDPRARDDIRLINEMVVPVGRPVHLHLRSRDVIHSFYVPEFRLYQDLVPGRTIGWVSFQADRTGIFAIACNQLCGAGHYDMQAPLRVVSEAEYQAWIAEKGAAARP